MLLEMAAAEFDPLLGIQAPNHFVQNANPDITAVSWKSWKRSLNLYLRAKNITNDSRKQAALLHYGGAAVQNVYFALVEEDEEKSFDETVELLDDNFLPLVNVPFERHQFRQECQKSNETVDQFVCRLRHKASRCEYTDVNEMICDQVIDKCNSHDLRKKFLEKQCEKALNLADVLKIARTFEAVDRQSGAMKLTASAVKSAAPQTNMVRRSNWKSSHSDTQTFKRSYSRNGNISCYACGGFGHMSTWDCCPAKNKTCAACGEIGHFKIKCPVEYEQRKRNSFGGRGKPNRGNRGGSTNRGGGSSSRGSSSHGSSGRGGARPKTGPRKVNQLVDYGNEQSDEYDEDYVFSVSSGENMTSTEIVIGGVTLGNVLIDSGSNRNVISRTTWEYLKSEKIRCKTKKVDSFLYPYGSKPIPVIGTFICDVSCKDTGKLCRAEFSVIDNSARSILSKKTSEMLDILRVGPPEINNLEEFPELCDGVGLLKGYSLKLNISDKVHPVAQPLRRIPFGLRKKVDEKLDELLASEIIEPVPEGPTTWVSPLVVIPKGDDVRICVDMRKANEAVVRERFPIPTVDDLLVDLNEASHFSKIDLKMGFHQIELSPESRYITTFVTHRGLFRYKRLMFGLSSAPEKYQQIIRDVLAECGEGVANIADDIIVFGRNLKEHDVRLRKVLERLCKVGLTVNAKKCKFRIDKLTFFGHQLTSAGVSPSDEKVQAVREASPPTNVSEVKSLLGLLQYCSRFIPDYSSLAEPIQQLCRKNVKFVWGNAQQSAFEKLKDRMINAKTLAYFKTEAKTRVIADASPYALGAVLTQFQGNMWRVVSYASRSLTDVERRYSQTEKEALALVWACERFSLYLYGVSFELETDHRPLEFIFGAKSKPAARVERWVLRMQAFDAKIVYRPGKSNIADCLSRLNNRTWADLPQNGDTHDYVCCIAKFSVPNAIKFSDFDKASENDVELATLRKCIMGNVWNDENCAQYKHLKDELCVCGNIVLRGTRLIVPKSLREQVLNLAHEGHQGICKTKSRLRTKVWWPKMDNEAEKLCRKCRSCLLLASSTPPEPMARTVPNAPWQDLAADLLGPLPSGHSILVVVDYYSRFYEVAVMKSTTSEQLINAIEPMFVRFGVPCTLKTDNGSNFVSNEFEEFLAEFGIRHVTSPPMWPQANGEVERQNRSLLKALKIAHAENKSWRKELLRYLIAYRSTPHVSTGASPYRLMFGREMKTKLPEITADMNVNDEEYIDKDWRRKIDDKDYADRKRRAGVDEVAVGDQVILKSPKTDKLSCNFGTVPHTVTSRVGGELVVESPDGTSYRRHTTAVKVLPPLNDQNPPGKVLTPLNDQIPPVEVLPPLNPLNDQNHPSNDDEPPTNEELPVVDEKEKCVPSSTKPVRKKHLPSKFKDYDIT